MQSYLALLRGVNVGGKGIVSMVKLREALEQVGLSRVRTYIQSGNILFESYQTDRQALALLIEQCIKSTFKVNAATIVIAKEDWQRIIAGAPAWWGGRHDWKHNLIIMIPPYDMTQIESAFGSIKPDIEAIELGEGVVYQSLSKLLLGRTTSGKLASSPAYKQLTVRNYSTALKLLSLL